MHNLWCCVLINHLKINPFQRPERLYTVQPKGKRSTNQHTHGLYAHQHQKNRCKAFLIHRFWLLTKERLLSITRQWLALLPILTRPKEKT